MKFHRSQLVGSVMAVALVVGSIQLFSAVTPVAAQDALYKTCEELKLTAPLSAQPAEAATAEATAAADAPTTEAATAASPAAAEDIAFLSIVGSDSEACYLASEKFLDNNMMQIPAGFNGAVGVTKTIAGDIALDRTNVANSQIGDITINISEFKSDNDRRDGFIRQRFLESNKYPFATLTNAVATGLPTGAYVDGTELKFQITGTLKVHDTERVTTFDATGTFTNGTLVVTATTDLKMSEFGITVPDIGGLLKVDDEMRLVVNLVARAAAEATPTPTA